MNKFKEVSFGLIPCEWNLSSIDNIKDDGKYAIAMGPFGSNIKSENYVDNGVPVIRGINLNYFKYVGGDFVFLTEEKAATLKSSICKTGDLVFTHRGTIGQVCLIPCGKFDKYIISQSGMKLTVDKNKIDNIFLLYFFKSKMGKNQILQYESQVGVPSISNPLSSLKMIEVPLPPLPEQKAIAGVLGSLDDKIDLLQRQNATLEAMAETLFRQWFIEEAQEDFRITSLSNIANFLNGLACQKYPPSNNIDKLPVLKIRELNNGISKDCDWATSDIKSEYIVKSGDVIFSWSGSLLVKIWNGEDCVLNQHLFKVTSQTYPKWFYFFWCKYHLKEFIIISESHATTMGHIKRSDLDAAEVLIPSDKRLQEMSYIMNPLWEKYITNQTQIRTLEKLRDTLLPKLMSGEVRVRVDG